jgi:predicted DNA-binding transcriptional regulator YafY
MSHQRLISCLLLLQGERRRTARGLAEALEVSTRTVYRDVEALSAAGVPIHMERGRCGGIVLADDYRRAIAHFTDDELQALFATAAGPMADLGFASHGSALTKLAGALPAAQRRVAERGRDRMLVDHNRWYRGAQPRLLLAELRRAVAAERRVSVQYRDRAGATTDRILEPLGLVAKAGIWYLVAREGDKGYRTFRCERIVSATTTTEGFERPAGFDLDAHWRSSVASIQAQPAESYDVTLAVRNDAVERVMSFWNADVVEVAKELTTLCVHCRDREAAAFVVLVLGEAGTIVSPDELRSAVVSSARAVLARYADTA